MKLIILDRDGVINEDSDDYIKSVEEWIPIPGSIEAIARLTKAGYTVAVATNQSGLARGYFDQRALEAMHDKLHDLLAARGGRVDHLAYCPHGPDDDCECRKPKPGMYEKIAQVFGSPLKNVWVVGDSLRDLQAAEEVSAQPVLVKTGKGERTLMKGHLPAGTRIFPDLSAAVDALISEDKNHV